MDAEPSARWKTDPWAVSRASNSVVQRAASSTAFCRTSLVLPSTVRPDLSMRPPVCSAAHWSRAACASWAEARSAPAAYHWRAASR